MGKESLGAANEYFIMHARWKKRIKARKKDQCELDVVIILSDLYSYTMKQLPRRERQILQRVMDSYRSGVTNDTIRRLIDCTPATTAKHLQALENIELIQKVELDGEERWVVVDEGFLFYNATLSGDEWRTFLDANRDRMDDDLVTEFIDKQTDRQEGGQRLLEWRPWAD